MFPVLGGLAALPRVCLSSWPSQRARHPEYRAFYPRDQMVTGEERLSQGLAVRWTNSSCGHKHLLENGTLPSKNEDCKRRGHKKPERKKSSETPSVFQPGFLMMETWSGLLITEPPHTWSSAWHKELTNPQNRRNRDDCCLHFRDKEVRRARHSSFNKIGLQCINTLDCATTSQQVIELIHRNTTSESPGRVFLRPTSPHSGR
ncbi:PREDICTED: uncharacterized protein LOC105592462 [Cercocebus atys]|uniref:uncharacterized protein LOC105592462 n=1 Tax=Cercocebus atys TaxID=9531 RepID=UPI0005F3A941|nr:PREDICTED: uncharacterized protein LOC105592462 [Cercocebus atys]